MKERVMVDSNGRKYITTEPEHEAMYGYCPECGAKGTKRERRIDGDDMCANGHIYFSKKAVYLTQPKKEWVGLTDEEFTEILCSEFQHRPELMLLQVQAKLKEKNNG